MLVLRREVEDPVKKRMSVEAVLLAARAGRRPWVFASDEVALARALRAMGASDAEMARIRFSHDEEELRKASRAG